MPDDAMFAPLPAGASAKASTGGAPRSKPVPIVPVPGDAPECTWRHPKYGAPVAKWPYHDAAGRLVAYAARVEFVGKDGQREKDVLPITWCRIGGECCAWRARALPAPRTLYRLPQLVADPAAPVIVTEGEKKADLAPSLFPGHVATTSMGGASAARQSDWSPLAGRKVIIWPDHDEPGRQYADDVAALATAAGAASVAIVPVPAEWPVGWDIADRLPEGAAPDALTGLLRSAIPWTAATALNEPNDEVDDAIVGRPAGLPPLIVHDGDLPATARELRDLLAAGGALYDRGLPVRLVTPADGGPTTARPLSVHNVVIEAHRVCRPLRRNSKGDEYPVTLPERVARMYLDMHGEWNLPPLAGVTMAPLLARDGSVRNAAGYDPDTGLLCCKVPSLAMPERPRHDDAVAALQLLRNAFRTFPFADSVRCRDPVLRAEVTDLAQPPGRDESAFLAALLTAICRPSLWLAPGFLIVAPQVSGAGTGKGLLVRAICVIAFGMQPRAFTAGHDRQELDKRLVAELVEAAPALFLDNVNAAVLRSETLASVLTERPARMRLLGQTRMVALNSTAFVAVTGNGLRVSEDLARRFLLCELDAHCEDPEARDFAPGFLEETERARTGLLSAAVTIWRYGREHAGELPRGRALGSFETWCEWVRDPLLALGCRDPVERVEIVKAQDPHRQQVAELFRTWHACHGRNPVKAAELHPDVLKVIDPQGRGRNYVVSRLGTLADTRSAGFMLTCQKAAGVWGAATYALHRTVPEGDTGAGHRDHRGHRGPVVPTVPMPDDLCGAAVPDAIDDDLRLRDNDEFGERAAILEYDGGYPRAEAERLAHAEIPGTA